MKRYPGLVLLSLLLVPACTFVARAQSAMDTIAQLNKIPSLYGIVFSLKDSIRYDRHFNGTKPDDVFDDQSLTKSIGSLLVGIAIDKGMISGLDEKLARWFPELASDTDKRKQDITLRELMNQASGLWHEELGTRMGIPHYLHQEDPAGYVVKQPLVADPGKEFHYNNAATHLLSVILTKSTGMDVRSFAQTNLFDPLDIHALQWEQWKGGYYSLAGLVNNLRLRTEDLIKIGSLFLHDGRYKGKQIVSAGWIGQLLHPDVVYDTPWGFHPSKYGLCWYHFNYRGNEMLYGQGWGGQYLIVIPALQLVFALNQSHEDSKADAQIGRFTQTIFPAFYDAVLEGKFN